jgi:alpha-tubulin suppressor-like RCC1 family protein
MIRFPRLALCPFVAVAAAFALACGDSSALRLTSITAGNGFTCGIRPDSTSVCWGANQYGQLGVASTSSTCALDPVATGKCSAHPVAVEGGHEFVAIDAGESHVCALDPDGRAFCWGDNASGQLGSIDSGETCAVDYYVQRGFAAAPCSRAPKAVATELSFISISAASGFTCALTRDGDAYCWGQWTNGRMGGGTGPMQGGSIVRFAATEAVTQISAD